MLDMRMNIHKTMKSGKVIDINLYKRKQFFAHFMQQKLYLSFIKLLSIYFPNLVGDDIKNLCFAKSFIAMSALNIPRYFTFCIINALNFALHVHEKS